MVEGSDFKEHITTPDLSKEKNAEEGKNQTSKSAIFVDLISFAGSNNQPNSYSAKVMAVS